ncbi:Yip1 family protein [Thermohalobacter berrensis]|uniref:Yip1 domain-containing protein n=1 Tax=Thermohalobacter berrensis TaxID=99594 RepID=A0A419T4I2_9FIRM|nr:Yip1 family protein [Thermohalobacter berrensis]RKD32355.1 hypothetical protein BET03_03345 [Thermohalobacter berrensis]
MTENINENYNNEFETEPFTWWERLKYVFTNPNKAFKNIAEYPKPLFPILLIIGVMLFLILIRVGLYKDFLRQQLVQQFSRQGMEMPNIENLLNAQLYISMIFIAITPLAIWLGKSVFINAISGLVGGEGSFKKGFRVIVYSYLPILLGQILVAIISLIIGKFAVPINFAIILPSSMEGGLLYNLLSQIDIFIIWYQVLAIIGVSYAYQISRKSASFLVLSSWIIWVLITSGLATIGRAM